MDKPGLTMDDWSSDFQHVFAIPNFWLGYVWKKMFVHNFQMAPERNNLLGGQTWSYDGQTNRGEIIFKFAFGSTNFTGLNLSDQHHYFIWIQRTLQVQHQWNPTNTHREIFHIQTQLSHN